MAFFLEVIALLFISKVLVPGECLTIRQAFFHKHEQRYLKNSIIDGKQAGDELECVMYCVEDESCVSVNFQISGMLKGLCELNNSSLTGTSDTCNPEFNHLYIVKKVRKMVRKIFQSSQQSIVWLPAGNYGMHPYLSEFVACIMAKLYIQCLFSSS